MKIKQLIASMYLLFSMAAQAQEYVELPLWPGDSLTEKASLIRVYLPEQPNGMAVIACPGGGYEHLAMDKEGYDFGPWLNQQNIACIVLKYRLPYGDSEIPLADAKQAMRIVKANAEQWHIHPEKIGIMGFSAGGHLASTLATHFDTDTRPAFQILFYPVITMDENYTHKGSRENLLGTHPTTEQIDLYSNEQQITPQTPPAFLLLNDDDKVVPAENGVNYYLALRRNHVPAEMHVYPSGGHGWGRILAFKYYNEWTGALQAWLKEFVK
jgi:acetyl esterase/lipase